MHSAFHAYIHTRAELSAGELERICSCATERVLQRKEFLFQEGDTCYHKTFIVTGLLRTFSIDEDGNEHILQFSPENTWTLDAESYDNQIPSRFNIDAIEESQVLCWHKKDFDQLLADMPALRAFSAQLISRAVHSGRHRLASALGGTPETKYNEFIRESPALAARLPLKMIAAYLGISLKTLTRLRHAQRAVTKQNMVK